MQQKGKIIMPKYAAQTSVSPERSRNEIERILTRYGAKQFAYGWGSGSAMIGFQYQNRLIRFVLSLPDANELRTPKGRRPHNIKAAHEQVTRQQWRALALAIKAKLELVESGITTFEQEFLAHVVLPNGQTVGEWATPQIETIYANRNMPPLLPGASTENDDNG
jgi:hypothetical protein